MTHWFKILLISIILFISVPTSQATHWFNTTSTNAVWIDEFMFPNTNLDGSNLEVFSVIGQRDRSLINFDYSSMPSNAAITGANISIYKFNDVNDPGTISVRNITSSWTETTVTWNTQPSVAAADGTTLTGAAIGRQTIDITQSLINKIRAGNTFGWMLYDETLLNLVHYYDDESINPPFLNISYNLDNVGNWTFNEGAGIYANDTSGFNNNGTITGATWEPNDVINNKSLYFDGTDYINISASPSINISDGQSFTGWIKPQSITGTHRIFEKGGTNWEYGVILGDNQLQYFIWQPSGLGHSVVGGGNVLNDTWIFISGTYSNNSVMNLYINNVLVGTTSSFTGSTSPGSDPLVFGRRTDVGQNFFGLMDEFKLYNYALNSSELTAEYQRFHPILTYPVNGSTVPAVYPPQTTNINFTWFDSVYPGDELLVSTDLNFNVLDVDIFTSNDYYLATLDVNKKYYWKIRQYNGTTGTYGLTSAVHNFTISSTGGATGQGIQGIVYEILGGLDTPIDQATVYIYNTTWSSTAVTGTNGYYLFSDLANGTYNMYAVKNGYDTTAVFPVTVNGTIATNDILMKIFISPYIPNFVFEKFIVRDLFDRSYIGVTATVYKGSSLTPAFSGTTDSTGAVVFQLIKDQRYRVTFSGGGISGTITIYVYAKEESYFVRVLTGFPTGGDRFTDISTNLTAVPINSTWSYLELIYNDTKASTSLVQFYAKNLSTNVTCYTNSTSSVVTLQCPVLASGSYQFGFNATSSIYGFFQEDKVINFDVGKPSTPAVNTTVDSDLLQWGSIILIVLTAALFSIRTVKYGAVIVPLEALALWAFGWFEPIVNNQAGSFLLLSCAVVLGVMIYLRGSEVKVNF